jgi:hypothetical protein
MRVLTAVAIIALCLFAALRGWSIAQFAHAEGISSRSDDLRGWVGVPGVTSTALQAVLAQVAVSGVEAARRRAERLTALVSVRPLSSEEWLSLAEMRLVDREPQKAVQSALFMSSITGPNEDYLMWQRGLFGLLIWQSLPAEALRQTIRDFAGALRGVPLGEREITAAKNLLGAKSEKARSEISHLLQTEGLSSTELGRVGL